jgi:hypothetical protein
MQKNGAGFLKFPWEFPGEIRTAGNDFPSGGQARPLGESIYAGKEVSPEGGTCPCGTEFDAKIRQIHLMPPQMIEL